MAYKQLKTKVDASTLEELRKQYPEAEKLYNKITFGFIKLGDKLFCKYSYLLKDGTSIRAKQNDGKGLRMDDIDSTKFEILYLYSL